MKKKILIITGLFLSGVLCLTACGNNLSLIGNKTSVDLTYTYDRAIISLQNGEVIEVNIQQWCDYEGEQIQVEATDGTIYLINSYNCTLINDPE